MIGVLIVTHGKLARELVSSARVILGKDPGFKYLCLSWDKNISYMRARVTKSIREADKGSGVLVLTDMFGGTPTNLVLPLIKEGQLEVVTGVNLPMILKLANLRKEEELSSAVKKVTKKGIESIKQASLFLLKEND